MYYNGIKINILFLSKNILFLSRLASSKPDAAYFSPIDADKFKFSFNLIIFIHFLLSLIRLSYAYCYVIYASIMIDKKREMGVYIVNFIA